MRCKNCGEVIENGTKFCNTCGAVIPVERCPKCGTVLKENESFCRHCGLNLGTKNKYEERYADVKNDFGEMINKAKDVSGHANHIKTRVTENYAGKIERESKSRPEGCLYYVDGREATIAVFEDYIELNFTTNVLKKYLSYLGGVKRIYYSKINSIQKRDASNLILGTIEFESSGQVKGRGGGLIKSENVIHYDKYYQEEVDKIYDFINDKILESYNAKSTQETPVPSEKTSLEQFKEAKELLDTGIITEEEFNKIKQKTLENL